jgi:hypothetical protein
MLVHLGLVARMDGGRGIEFFDNGWPRDYIPPAQLQAIDNRAGEKISGLTEPDLPPPFHRRTAIPAT